MREKLMSGANCQEQDRADMLLQWYNLAARLGICMADYMEHRRHGCSVKNVRSRRIRSLLILLHVYIYSAKKLVVRFHAQKLVPKC